MKFFIAKLLIPVFSTLGSTALAQGTDDALKKVIAVQQAQIADLQHRLCAVTVEAHGNDCVKIKCGTQEKTLCSGKDGAPGAPGVPGAPGAPGAPGTPGANAPATGLVKANDCREMDWACELSACPANYAVTGVHIGFINQCAGNGPNVKILCCRIGS